MRIKENQKQKRALNTNEYAQISDEIKYEINKEINWD